jgi:hypothetical protein
MRRNSESPTKDRTWNRRTMSEVYSISEMRTFRKRVTSTSG